MKKAEQIIKLFPNICNLRKNSLKMALHGIENALSTLNDCVAGKCETDLECAVNMLIKSTECLEGNHFDSMKILDHFLSFQTHIIEMKAKLVENERKIKRLEHHLRKFKMKRTFELKVLRRRCQKLQSLRQNKCRRSIVYPKFAVTDNTSK